MNNRHYNLGMIPEEVRWWANATMSCGVIGGCAGFLHHKFLSGLLSNVKVHNASVPTATLVVAHTLNCTLIGGVYFASRATALKFFASPSENDIRVVSMGAGAVTGFGVYSVFSGSFRKGLLGAVGFGAAGLLGQLCTEFMWQSARKQSSLSPESSSTIIFEQTPAERPGLGPTTLSWLPINLSPRESDQVRLNKERRRLQELNEVLGLASPFVHPKAIELLSRERSAIEAIRKSQSNE